jgi:hypothetical protein
VRDLSLHLLDIIQNSIKAKATKITIFIVADATRDQLDITVRDNGAGMDRELLGRVVNPFATTRTTRKVGMGVPLLKESCEKASGKLEIESAKGEGTTLAATFKISHIDRQPLGNIGETLSSVILSSPGIEFEILLDNKNNSFKFNSYEVKEKLGEVPITEYEVITWIREYVKEGIKKIFGGVLDEVDS